MSDYLWIAAGVLVWLAAGLVITDDGKDYGMHNGIAVVTMMSEWDEAGNQMAEYTEFQL